MKKRWAILPVIFAAVPNLDGAVGASGWFAG